MRHIILYSSCARAILLKNAPSPIFAPQYKYGQTFILTQLDGILTGHSQHSLQLQIRANIKRYSINFSFLIQQQIAQDIPSILFLIYIIKIYQKVQTKMLSQQNDSKRQQTKIKSLEKQKDQKIVEPAQEKKDFNAEANMKESERKNQLVGVIIIVFQVGCLVAYFSGSYSMTENTTYPQFFSLLMLAFFVIMGFGMVLSIFRFGSWLGIATAIITVAMSLHLSPILQKIFFGVLNTSYGAINLTENVGDNVKIFWTRYVSTKIQIGQYVYRTSFISCISFLTLMTSLIGRITITQIVNGLIVFQIVWNINFFLLVYFCVIKQDHREGSLLSPFIFDTFGTSYAYLFAAFYGIIFNLLIKRQTFPSSHHRNISNAFTLLMSMIGTACILSSFVFTSNGLIAYSFFGQNLKRFSMFFAIIGSVTGTFIGSVLSGKGSAGYKEVLVGTITGGILMGGPAPALMNIGISIAVGLVGGIISGLTMNIIEKKINKTNLYDVLGLFGPFIISAILGSVVVPILTLHIYYNQQSDIEYKKIFGTAFPFTLVPYQLIYPGISAALGLIGGAISGLVCRMEKDTFGFMTSGRYFVNDFGLKQKQMKKKNKSVTEKVDVGESAAMILDQQKKQM